MERIRGGRVAGTGGAGEGLRASGFVCARVPDRARKTPGAFRGVDRGAVALARVVFPPQRAGVLGRIFLASAVFAFLHDGTAARACVVVLCARTAGGFV